MPKLKKEEKDEELDIKAPQKNKETFVTRWFNEYVKDDKHEMMIICENAATSLSKQFCLSIDRDHNEVFAVIFYATFISILEFLRTKQKKYKRFTIKICNSINIGFELNEDDEDENQNFTPIMEYIGINRNIVNNDTSTIQANQTAQNYIRWKELNIKTNVQYCKEIQERAMERIKKEYKINLRTSEAIIPIFCVFMDQISENLSKKYREYRATGISQVSMNVMGLFDIFYSYDEAESKDRYEFEPNVAMKLALKDDETANLKSV